MRKSSLILAFLLIISMSFVSSASFPAPFTCVPERDCPEGYKLVEENIAIGFGVGSNIDLLGKTDNCGEEYRCLEILPEPKSSVQAGNIQTTLGEAIPSTEGSIIIGGESVNLTRDSDLSNPNNNGSEIILKETSNSSEMVLCDITLLNEFLIKLNNLEIEINNLRNQLNSQESGNESLKLIEENSSNLEINETQNITGKNKIGITGNIVSEGNFIKSFFQKIFKSSFGVKKT